MEKTKTICIVDDELAIRETLVNVLSDEGYDVFSCEDSISFFKKLEKQTPSLVLLDTGVKVCAKLWLNISGFSEY